MTVDFWPMHKKSLTVGSMDGLMDKQSENVITIGHPNDWLHMCTTKTTFVQSFVVNAFIKNTKYFI